MSVHQVFSVKDSKAAAFALPFFMPRMEVALRGFKDAVANPEHDMARHPEDYALFMIGRYDDESGLLEACEPVLVAKAIDCVPRQAEPIPLSQRRA